MNQLTINENCNNCRECDIWMPGLTHHIPQGRLIISDTNAARYSVELKLAIDNCPNKALKLELLK